MLQLLDPALLSRFDTARDALLSELHRSCNYTAIRHAAYSTLSSRSDIDDSNDDPADLGTLILRTVESTQQSLLSLQTDLINVQNTLHKLRARTITSFSPIANLPIELLSEILAYAIEGPQRHRTIVSLASVCETWRVVVHGMKWAFVQADWDRWPADVLERWCARARGSPLIVKLGVQGVAQLLTSPSSSYARVFDAHKSTCGTLEVYTNTHQLQSNLFTRLLMNEGIDSVRRLILTVCRSSPLQDMIHIPNEASFPHLEELHMNGTFIDPTSSFAGVRSISLGLSPQTPWFQWTSTLASATRLEDLVLKGGSLKNIEDANTLELPHVTSLRLQGWQSAEVLVRALIPLRLPNLQHVTVEHMLTPSSSAEHSQLIPQTLARTAPRLLSLTFSEYTTDGLGAALGSFRGTDGPKLRSLLPELKKIVFYRTYTPHSQVPLVGPQRQDILRNLVRLGSVQELRIPSRFVPREVEDELRALIRDLVVSDSPPWA